MPEVEFDCNIKCKREMKKKIHAGLRLQNWETNIQIVSSSLVEFLSFTQTNIRNFRRSRNLCQELCCLLIEQPANNMNVQ